MEAGNETGKSNEVDDQSSGTAKGPIHEGGDGAQSSLTSESVGIVRTQLSRIKNLFQTILNNNEAAEELDKLSRLELLVDHEAYDAQNRICKEKVTKLQRDIALQNLRRY